MISVLLADIAAVMAFWGSVWRAWDRKAFLPGPILAISILLMVPYAVWGHDPTRPELNSWFDGLSSGKGACCSRTDGTVLSDVDWESKDGHYRVRIEGHWWDVPDEAVLTGPNRAGPTMVWPVYSRGLHGELIKIDIRCFIPGSMT
jgi:hypothetical protein